MRSVFSDTRHRPDTGSTLSGCKAACVTSRPSSRRASIELGRKTWLKGAAAALQQERPGGCAWPMHSMERATGIEPALEAWEAPVLPLNYARISRPLYRSPSSFPRSFQGILTSSALDGLLQHRGQHREPSPPCADWEHREPSPCVSSCVPLRSFQSTAGAFSRDARLCLRAKRSAAGRRWHGEDGRHNREHGKSRRADERGGGCLPALLPCRPAHLPHEPSALELHSGPRQARPSMRQ